MFSYLLSRFVILSWYRLSVSFLFNSIDSIDIYCNQKRCVFISISSACLSFGLLDVETKREKIRFFFSPRCFFFFLYAKLSTLTYLYRYYLWWFFTRSRRRKFLSFLFHAHIGVFDEAFLSFLRAHAIGMKGRKKKKSGKAKKYYTLPSNPARIFSLPSLSSRPHPSLRPSASTPRSSFATPPFAPPLSIVERTMTA